jgi:hypothetical protein
VEIPPDIPVVINTLEDALFKNRINDISFELGDRLVVLIEHQSSVNPNMPVRLLSYAARVYEKILAGKRKNALYGKKRLVLARPEFIVLYNGTAPFPDRAVMRLSDSFAAPAVPGLPADAPLELVVKVYK